MKLPLSIFASLALGQSLFADATCYQALSYLSEQKGASALRDVYLIRGVGGNPQPDEWTLYRGKPSATAFRVTAVRGDGKIFTGKAPVRAQGLPPDALPLNLSVLNVDTHAAWKIAKRAARREHFSFTSADYQLTTHPLGRVPAWTMLLFNERQGTMGIITLSGATGEVLNSLKLYSYQVISSDGVEERIAIREPRGRRAARSVGRWFSRSGEAYGHDLLNAAGTTEEILFNRRTRHFSEDMR